MIDVDGLNFDQLDGIACVRCGASAERLRPLPGWGPRGQLFECADDCEGGGGMTDEGRWAIPKREADYACRSDRNYVIEMAEAANEARLREEVKPCAA